MRRVISYGSVKAVSLNRDAVLEQLDGSVARAFALFPEIEEIRIFGSFASGDLSPLSDLDILVIVDQEGEGDDPLIRMKPYFNFFSDNMDIGVDVLVVAKDKLHEFSRIIKGSRLVSRRTEESDND